MQITFNPILNNTVSKQHSSKNCSVPACSKQNANLMTSNAVYFMGKVNSITTIGKTGIKKIKSEKEYDEVLNRLKNDKSWWCQWSNPMMNKYEEGIMPYIGENDISHHINIFMRTGEPVPSLKYTPELLTDYIRVMDYALKKIDKIYGKHKGVVYRYGYFDINPQNFVSTAKKPNGAAIFVNDDARQYEYPFHVIYTKNGHKAEEVQRKFSNNPAYLKESEIILNPDSHYEIITEITPEMEAEKAKISRALREENNHVHEFKTIFYREV